MRMGAGGDNMIAWEAYEKAKATAREAYKKATAPAEEAYENE